MFKEFVHDTIVSIPNGKKVKIEPIWIKLISIMSPHIAFNHIDPSLFYKTNLKLIKMEINKIMEKIESKENHTINFFRWQSNICQWKNTILFDIRNLSS